MTFEPLVDTNAAPCSDPSAGHVYYLKLKTSRGPMYKLGFTTKTSIRERFSFDGSEDYKLIDKEFIFTYLPNAYEIEQRLHRLFQHSRGKVLKRYEDPTLPLYKNGQSELYYEDILELDPEYVPSKYVDYSATEDKEVGVSDYLNPFSSLYGDLRKQVSGNVLVGILITIPVFMLYVPVLLIQMPWHFVRKIKDSMDSRNSTKAAARELEKIQEAATKARQQERDAIDGRKRKTELDNLISQLKTRNKLAT